MKVLFLLAFQFLLLPVYGQVLKGIITIQNSGSLPIPGVQIISAGANPVITQANGKFEIVYADKRKGDNVHLQVEKEGYEIVNHKDLDTRLRENANDLVALYMCAKGELAIRRLKYYEIQEKYVTKRYKDELEKLRRENKDTRTALHALDEQRRKALAYIKDLSDKFATTNLDDCSGRYQQAFKAFEKGDIARAITLLDESENDMVLAQKELSDAEDLSDIAAQKIKVAKADRKKAIDCFMLKADLLVAGFHFDDAEKYYKKGVDADTTDLATNFRLAYYLQVQNLYSQSRFYYNRVLSLPGFRQVSPEFTATIFHNTGLLDFSNNEMANAESNYLRSLDIFKQLVKENPAHEYQMGAIYNDLGDVYHGFKKVSEAKNNYLNSLEIRKKGIDSEPLLYAETLNKLGNLYVEDKDFENAAFTLLKALEIEKKEIKSREDHTNMIQVETLTYLGELYLYKADLLRSEQYSKTALEICDALSKQNPQKYDQYKSVVLHTLANTYLRGQQYNMAKRAFRKAIDIRTILAKSDPAAFEPFIAVDLQSLGNISLHTGDTLHALKTYGEALVIYRRITPKDSFISRPYIAEILITMALIHAIQNAPEQAEKEMNELVSIYEELAIHNRAIYLTGLAQAYLTAANICLLNSPTRLRVDKGRLFLKKAKETLSKCKNSEEVSALAGMLQNLDLVYKSLD